MVPTPAGSPETTGNCMWVSSNETGIPSDGGRGELVLHALELHPGHVPLASSDPPPPHRPGGLRGPS